MLLLFTCFRMVKLDTRNGGRVIEEGGGFRNLNFLSFVIKNLGAVYELNISDHRHYSRDYGCSRQPGQTLAGIFFLGH